MKRLASRAFAWEAGWPGWLRAPIPISRRRSLTTAGTSWLPWGKATEAPFELAQGIKCPVLFHFGEMDANPSQDDMRKLDEELTRLGITHQFYTYPGADHGFMDYTAARYRREASDASWARTLNFFDQHLKGGAAI